MAEAAGLIPIAAAIRAILIFALIETMPLTPVASIAD
jgi:hypothetical protein